MRQGGYFQTSFCFLRALFVLKIFNFSSYLFGHVGRSCWLKVMVMFVVFKGLSVAKLYQTLECAFKHSFLQGWNSLFSEGSPPPLMFLLFDMQEKWTWNISNNYIIKSDVCIKLRYIRYLKKDAQNQEKGRK